MGAGLPCSTQAPHCNGVSCCGPWALGVWPSVAVAHGLSCSKTCGIFSNQRSNLCPHIGREILIPSTTGKVPGKVSWYWSSFCWLLETVPSAHSTSEAAFTPWTNCYRHLWCARHRACILEQAGISPVILGLTLERVTDRLCAGLSHVRLFVTPWTVTCQVTHEISQARILDRVAISFSRASSCFRDWTWISCVSCIGRQITVTDRHTCKRMSHAENESFKSHKREEHQQRVAGVGGSRGLSAKLTWNWAQKEDMVSVLGGLSQVETTASCVEG